MPSRVGGGDAGRLAWLLEHGPECWSVDMFEMHQLTGGHALSALGWALFERHGVRAALGISADRMRAFLAAVEGGYHSVPYHNSVHAACVTHGLHWLLTCSDNLRGVAPAPLQMLAVLLAAMVHDLGHDGCNNSFHCAANDEIAVRYAYSSPLERHHLASLFAILKDPSTDILSHLPPDELRYFRETVVSMVLATDFEKHASVLSKFTALVSSNSFMEAGDEHCARRRQEATPAKPLFCSRPDWGVCRPCAAPGGASTLEVEEERRLILQILIKTADLGNLSKGCDYCLAFTDGVMKEFFSQGDRERSLGLPLTPGYQRESADVASSQLAFYRFIVEPLYSAVDNLVPAGELLSNLEHMRTEWEAKRQASLEDQLAWLRTSRERIV